MNGIELSEKVGGVASERLRLQPCIVIVFGEFCEQSSHFAIDIFGIAECAAALGYPYCARFAGPGVNILKKMPVDRAISFVAQIPGWQRLGCTLGGDFRLKGVKLILIFQLQLVPENRRSG